MTDKNYTRIKKSISDAIDMAYMKGIEQAYGDSIVNNSKFKKYRSQLIDFTLERNDILSLSNIRSQEQLDKDLSEAFKKKEEKG